ncbi:MAG: hypothetical protein LLF83_00775 [Methanobacterium sp.]|nr:hypothetical protein [Methanobacterium sp.]
MSTYKAMLVVVKCAECGHENVELIKLVISEEDWLKTQEKCGEMIKERIW